MSMMYFFILKGCLIKHGHLIVVFLEITTYSHLIIDYQKKTISGI
jgi:hypothetical protein